MKFNEKLKTLRETKGFTQDDIASKLNIARQSISKWEQGINEPDIDKIKQLCNIFDCSIAELIDDDKEVVPTKEERRTKTANTLFNISIMVVIATFLTLLAMVFAAKDTAILHIDINGKTVEGSKWAYLAISALSLLGLAYSIPMKILGDKNKIYIPYKVSLQVGSLVINALLCLTFIVLFPFLLRFDTIPAYNLTIAITYALIISIAPFTHPIFNKSNPLIGFKSKFTLSNKEAWKKVNSFSSITLFALSILGYILSLIFIKQEWATWLIVILIISVIPMFIYHEILSHKVKK